MRARGLAAIAAVLLMPGAALWAAAKDATLVLRFIPQESTGISSPEALNDRLHQPLRLVFEDARALDDPLLVGDGTNDNDEPFSWRATTSVADFTRGQFTQLAAGWGVTLSAESPITLKVKLVRFWVAERNQAVGSTYAAEVRVTRNLEDAEGKLIGRLTGAGEAHRYGRKRSAENCMEVLSDAMKAAYASALTEQDAAQPEAPAPPAAPAPDEPVTPAALLEELLKLKAAAFSNEILIQYVSGKTLTAPLAAADLLAWKDAGLSEEVIRAAISRPAPGKKEEP